MRKYTPFILALSLVLLAAAAYAYWQQRPAARPEAVYQAAGVIEAGAVRLSPEIGGRISEVSVDEGDAVRAGQTLVVLDRALVNAQRDQAAANLEAAQATEKAAAGHLASLQAGPPDEALAVAQSGIDLAQAELTAAKEAYTNLSDRLKDQAEGKALKARQAQAEAAVRAAQAEYNLVKAGARQPQVDAARAELDAAAAQVKAAQAALQAIEIQRGKYELNAPAAGVILERTAAPGEYAPTGSVLLVIGRLDRLTLTVYVPGEQVAKFQPDPERVYPVSVSAFPEETFEARVDRIEPASGSRETPTFAVRLTLDNPGGKLKPGMPASIEIR